MLRMSYGSEWQAVRPVIENTHSASLVHVGGTVGLYDRQGRRQVKICGMDRHGERRAQAYNGGLEAEPPAGSRGRATLTCRQILRRPVGHFQTNVWNRLASQVRTLTGPTSFYPAPCKNSSDLYQSQERPAAKVGWTCRPQSTPWRRRCL